MRYPTTQMVRNSFGSRAVHENGDIRVNANLRKNHISTRMVESARDVVMRYGPIYHITAVLKCNPYKRGKEREIWERLTRSMYNIMHDEPWA